MTARSYFYRLGQKARAWNLPIYAARRALMPGCFLRWATEAFERGYYGWSAA